VKVLLVEDEEHKSMDLRKRIEAVLENPRLTIKGGVRDAVIAVAVENFELIVLDMALPTFDGRARKVSGGEAQVVGGLEVLRALHATGKSTKVIIVTQYPDVVLGGNKVRLNQLPKTIAQKYNQDVLGAILYSFNSPQWEATFDSILGKIR
jgi:CheY-like chemotaxis protein